jgi:hypothetical protein
MPGKTISNAVPNPEKWSRKDFEGGLVGPREAFVQELVEEGADPNLAFGPMAFSSKDGFFSEGLGLYEFCTENILEYLPLLDVEGKRCLTVASSGDHTINLLMAGAREVVAFDSVQAAGEVTWLKMQALVDLEWRDSGHFRGSLWREALAHRNFARLCDRAVDPSYGNSRSIVGQAVCALPAGQVPTIFKRYQITGRNAYIASEDGFEKAKRACASALSDGRVSFTAADIRELPLLGIGEFDVIVVSNILQSALDRLSKPKMISRDAGRSVGDRGIDLSEALDGLVQSMIWPAARMLAPGGVMMASYTYACDRADDDLDGGTGNMDPIRSTETRRRAFNPPIGFVVEEHAFQTINGASSGEDVVVLIRREGGESLKGVSPELLQELDGRLAKGREAGLVTTGATLGATAEADIDVHLAVVNNILKWRETKPEPAISV